MTKIKPASTNIDRDPFPQLQFEHELMEPPPLLHVIWLCAGILWLAYMALIGTRTAEQRQNHLALL